MDATTDSARSCSDLVGALADAGVTHAFVSPGSRNTPLTLAVAAEPRITDLSIRDERSAGFIALGLAKATGTPAVVICTSGSAATHYYPAVVEADQSATPLIILSADRPVQLRGTGAPQTLDQTDLYGTHVKTFVDLDATFDGSEAGTHLFSDATTGVAGPVHANFPFDEPLLPSKPVGPSESRTSFEPTRDTAPALPSLDGFDKILFVASGRQSEKFAAELERVTSLLRSPAVVDAQVTAGGTTIVDSADLIAGSGYLDRLTPDVVVRLGPLPTSKALWQWLDALTVPQFLVDNSRLADPLSSGSATHIVHDPAAVLASTKVTERSNQEYLAMWQAADTVATAALTTSMTTLPFPNEPAIARQVAMSIQPDDILWLASSMPIRDVNSFAPGQSGSRILSNRGVNGIDGNISSAVGAALAAPTTLLIGDIAALHDVSALAEAAALQAPLRIVVVNNNGGGIFSFLPQATSPVVVNEAYEKHWGTPHGLALVPIASSMGVASANVHSARELDDVLSSRPEGVELIEIRTDRDANVSHHAHIRTAVATALSSAAIGD
ncbi:MAG: 2-succinyl-5-enolpyruvyl-6-hydroxy-3-cyclohexene-1-carboxylic-acid synthase [Acidimicrobiia bacterium]